MCNNVLSSYSFFFIGFLFRINDVGGCGVVAKRIS